jgi:site-specific recombinase XerD
VARLPRDPQIEALIDAYRAELIAAGHFAENEVTSPARAFLLRVGGATGWSRLSVEEQQRICEPRESALVMWMIAAGHVRPQPEFLVRGYQRLGKVSAWVHREFHRRFMATAAGLGFSPKVAELQWWAVAKVAAVAGVAPDKLTRAKFDAASREVVDAVKRFGARSARVTLSTRLYGAEATLYHAGVIDGAPRKRAPNQSTVRAGEWASVPPRLAATLQGYVEQMRVTLRPNSMPHIERTLREFALWLGDQAPEVTAVRDLRRSHIERFKRHVAQKPNLRGGRLSKRTIAGELSTLRICLERLAEWDSEDAPARTLMFPGDVPKLDDPLPRFIDDGAAKKLIQAARATDDPFARLAVEFLARTGLRRGEFLDLKIDSVVQIGSAYWLHVPLGKLRSDRYIPLHPQLKELLDEWVARRPASLREPWLFMDHGRRLGAESVRKAVQKVAREAGLDNVTPHQLRHTLATQAINRGMSLEAIAALLGHKSMRMTMVYAKISNRTVADEYFKVSEQVEALYDAPKELPAEAEGSEMRKLRSEMHRRMLGNGYCARPVGLDCHFESICESCVYFQTTLEFRPTLKRQRDDAADKGQVARLKIFDGLLDRLDTQAKAS